MFFFYFFITAFSTTLAGSVRSNGETNVTTTDLTMTALDGKKTGYLKEILLNQELSQKVQLVQNVVQVMADVQTLKQEDNSLKTENADLRREVMADVQTLKQEVNRLNAENVDLRRDVQSMQQEVSLLKTENFNLTREDGNVSSNDAGSSYSHSKCVANVALGKSVSVSSIYDNYQPSNAVNGYLNDFMHTTYSAGENRPWLTIDLGGTFLIQEIEIFNRADCCGSKFHDAEVTIGKSLENLQFCGHYSGSAGNGKRITMWCPPHTLARFVKIQIVKGSGNVLHVAEVFIWGVPEGPQYFLPSTNCMNNVALGKPVNVSTTYGNYKPSNAVNGYLNDLMHTTYPAGESRPWLTIDLGDTFIVHQVEIFNRADCCGYKFHDADVKVGRSLSSVHSCGHYTGPTQNGERIVVTCPSHSIARFVKIQIVKGTGNVLHVAEVIVWGLRYTGQR